MLRARFNGHHNIPLMVESKTTDFTILYVGVTVVVAYPGVLECGGVHSV